MKSPQSTAVPIAALALAVALAATAAADIRGEADAMLYRIIEHYYGPEIRPNDWRSNDARLVTAGGTVQAFLEETPSAQVTRADYPLPGGGDVELTVQFNFERMGEQGRVEVQFNCPRRGEPGFSLIADRQATVVMHLDEQVHSGPPLSFDRGAVHTVRLATLDRQWAMWLDETLLAHGQMVPPYTQNEGRLRLSLTDADVRIISCEENFIAHTDEPPAWERTKLLYEERFGAASLAEHWFSWGETPQAEQDCFRFYPMSNHILRQRFSGPLAVDCTLTPLPSERHTAGISDTISIWMLDDPEGDLLTTLAQVPDANLAHVMHLPFYWVDMGGTNNQTTRFRRNPDRQLRRQFTDRARLLERDRSYRLTLVQNGNFVEYWVDGQPWLRLYDSEPLAEGHIGFRSFNAGLQVSEVQVWRIR